MAPDLGIIHVDMDAFYAAVEQRDNPQLRGRPVVVGGSPHSRGVVCAASYEARAYGIHSALPTAEAYRRCPHATFVAGRMSHYQRVSAQIMAVLGNFTDRVEPLSLDEAYLDVGAGAVLIGRQIKAEVARSLGLTASIGVSYNKLLSKLASDMDKPNGFVVIDRTAAEKLLPALPVGRLWGIGPKTEARLKALGIRTAGDLAAFPLDLLERNLGSRALDLVQMARGVDHRPVLTESQAKSVGEETTLAVDTDDVHQLVQLLGRLSSDVWQRLARLDLRYRTVTLKARYDDFSDVSRSLSFDQARSGAADIERAVIRMLAGLALQGRKIRLVGVQASNLESNQEALQLTLPLEELSIAGSC